MQSGKCLLMNDGIREDMKGWAQLISPGSVLPLSKNGIPSLCYTHSVRSHQKIESLISNSLLPHPFPLLCGVDDSYETPPLNSVGLALR